MNERERRAAIDREYIGALNVKMGGVKGQLASIRAKKEADTQAALEAAGAGADQDIDDLVTPPVDDDLKDEKPEGDDTDGNQEADKAIEKVDLDAMSSEGKLELIRIIIDSAQNSSNDDDEFSDFMNGVLDIMDEFQVVDNDETPEGGDEGEGGEEGNGDGEDAGVDDIVDDDPDFKNEPDDK